MKKLSVKSSDYFIVRDYLNKWGVSYKEKDGYFKLQSIEATAVCKKLEYKLILHHLK